MTWLLVEDDNDIRNVVSVMMSVWGEKPLAFADGSAAWKWLDSVNDGTFKGELPDLALMDIRMPGYTGDKVAARIRQTTALKDIPIILMTAFALSEIEARLMMEQAGVDHLIYKPLPDMDVFKTTLYQVRDQRRTVVNSAQPPTQPPAQPPAQPVAAAPTAPVVTPPVVTPVAPAPAAPTSPAPAPTRPPAPATPQPSTAAQPATLTPSQPPAPSPAQPAKPTTPPTPGPAQPVKPPQPPAQTTVSTPLPPQAPPPASPQPTKQATSPQPAAPPSDNKRQDKPGNDRK